MDKTVAKFQTAGKISKIYLGMWRALVNTVMNIRVP
jgi:hypothetical protein